MKDAATERFSGFIAEIKVRISANKFRRLLTPEPGRVFPKPGIFSLFFAAGRDCGRHPITSDSAFKLEKQWPHSERRDWLANAGLC